MEITNIDQLDFSKQYSYADYLTWKFTETVELLRGKIAQMAAPIWRHQQVSYNVLLELGVFFKTRPCLVLPAPVDVRIPKKPNDPDDKVYTVVQPDICVLCHESGQYSNKNGWVGIPDLVIEIVSPSTRKRDLGEKKDIYEEAKVKEYWVIFPLEKMVFLYELHHEKYKNFQVFTTGDLMSSALFPDFSLKVDDIFAKIDD